MTNAANDRRIDYIEFPATDIPSTKTFYNQVFGWEFQDYGPDYTSFHDGRIAGGFTTDSTVSRDGVLVVIYSTDLNVIESKIKAAGGKIEREQFDFPGGKRFHFSDPNGNILAVWSDATS